MSNELSPTEELTTEPPHVDSHIGTVSIRAWIAILLVSTVCFMAVFAMKVEEPLYSMATLALGFYFGQKTKS